MDPVMTARVARWVWLSVLGLYFLVPQLAMARFAFQNVPVVLLGPDTWLTKWSAQPLVDAVSDPRMWQATGVSVGLAVATVVVTVVVLVPPTLYAEVRAPWLRPWLGAATVVPWVVPPIALVVGVAASFRSVWPTFLTSPWSLVPFYAIWSLPFTYRALDAGLRSINARTLVEAATSLGQSVPAAVVRVVFPNLLTSLVAAAGLTSALVLGEFAFASLLLKRTLPTYLVEMQRSDPRAGMALALVVMLVTAVALGAVVRLLRRRGIDTATIGI
jgi:putative spermidine/putrescine transport system permease protein